MSVLSMFLCFTMLIGTTFAWFTDEVESGVNTIVAGNLDVDVLVNDEDEGLRSIEQYEKLFNDIKLWEPGAVAYENITVVKFERVEACFPHFGQSLFSRKQRELLHDLDLVHLHWNWFVIVESDCGHGVSSCSSLVPKVK
jgi:predicted ribosomally synthesized peptide with SipW-like signal peptide